MEVPIEHIAAGAAHFEDEVVDGDIQVVQGIALVLMEAADCSLFHDLSFEGEVVEVGLRLLDFPEADGMADGLRILDDCYNSLPEEVENFR